MLTVVPASAQNSAAAGVVDSEKSLTGSQTPEKKRPPKKKSKHPSFKIGEHVTVSPELRVERDFRAATPDIGRDDSSTYWEDRRVGIQGTAYNRVTFALSRELGDDFAPASDEPRESAWRDAYIKTRVSRPLTVTVGRFKEPFGREALTGESNLDYINRSLAARVLSPSRDTGVGAEGRLLDRLLEYQVGYFTRDGDNSRTTETEGGTDAIVGRLLVSPFARGSANRFLEPLQVGLAVANSRLDDRLGLRGRTVLGDGIFFDRVYVNGRRQRTGLEGAWEYGPASLSTEYITVSDQRTGMGFSGEDLPAVHATGWYVSGTWALTGERKHGRLEPRRDLLRGGFGAVEIAARVERLTFGAIDYPGSQFGFPTLSKLAGNTDRATTIGVNWYLNDYVKIQTNVITETISDPGRGPSVAANGRFTSTLVRFQFRL